MSYINAQKLYSIYCKTEGKTVYCGSLIAPPTRCPRDQDHVIDTRNIRMIKSSEIRLSNLTDVKLPSNELSNSGVLRFNLLNKKWSIQPIEGEEGVFENQDPFSNIFMPEDPRIFPDGINETYNQSSTIGPLESYNETLNVQGTQPLRFGAVLLSIQIKHNDLNLLVQPEVTDDGYLGFPPNTWTQVSKTHQKIGLDIVSNFIFMLFDESPFTSLIIQYNSGNDTPLTTQILNIKHTVTHLDGCIGGNIGGFSKASISKIASINQKVNFPPPNNDVVLFNGAPIETSRPCYVLTSIIREQDSLEFLGPNLIGLSLEGWLRVGGGNYDIGNGDSSNCINLIKYFNNTSGLVGDQIFNIDNLDTNGEVITIKNFLIFDSQKVGKNLKPKLDFPSLDVGVPDDADEFAFYDNTTGDLKHKRCTLPDLLNNLEIQDLGNVTIDNLQDCQILKWNETSGQWENSDFTLENLTNVDESVAPAIGDALVFSSLTALQPWKAQPQVAIDGINPPDGQETQIKINNPKEEGQALIYDDTSGLFENKPNNFLDLPDVKELVEDPAEGAGVLGEGQMFMYGCTNVTCGLKNVYPVITDETADPYTEALGTISDPLETGQLLQVDDTGKITNQTLELFGAPLEPSVPPGDPLLDCNVATIVKTSQYYGYFDNNLSLTVNSTTRVGVGVLYINLADDAPIFNQDVDTVIEITGGGTLTGGDWVLAQAYTDTSHIEGGRAQTYGVYINNTNNPITNIVVDWPPTNPGGYPGGASQVVLAYYEHETAGNFNFATQVVDSYLPYDGLTFTTGDITPLPPLNFTTTKESIVLIFYYQGSCPFSDNPQTLEINADTSLALYTPNSPATWTGWIGGTGSTPDLVSWHSAAYGRRGWHLCNPLPAGNHTIYGRCLHLSTGGNYDGSAYGVLVLDAQTGTPVVPEQGNTLVYNSTENQWETRELCLDDLCDVTTNTLTDCDTLVFNGTSNVFENKKNTVENLCNTNITSVQDGDLLTFNQTSNEWQNIQPAPTSLNELTDVTLSTAQDCDTLVFNGTSNVFENKQNTVENLCNVGITAVQDKQIIVYDNNSSEWINQAPTAIDTTTTGPSTKICIKDPIEDQQVVQYNLVDNKFVNQALNVCNKPLCPPTEIIPQDILYPRVLFDGYSYANDSINGLVYNVAGTRFGVYVPKAYTSGIRHILGEEVATNFSPGPSVHGGALYTFGIRSDGNFRQEINYRDGYTEITYQNATAGTFLNLYPTGTSHPLGPSGTNQLPLTTNPPNRQLCTGFFTHGIHGQILIQESNFAAGGRRVFRYDPKYKIWNGWISVPDYIDPFGGQPTLEIEWFVNYYNGNSPSFNIDECHNFVGNLGPTQVQDLPQGTSFHIGWNGLLKISNLDLAPGNETVETYIHYDRLNPAVTGWTYPVGGGYPPFHGSSYNPIDGKFIIYNQIAVSNQIGNASTNVNNNLGWIIIDPKPWFAGTGPPIYDYTTLAITNFPLVTHDNVAGASRNIPTLELWYDKYTECFYFVMNRDLVTNFDPYNSGDGAYIPCNIHIYKMDAHTYEVSLVEPVNLDPVKYKRHRPKQPPYDSSQNNATGNWSYHYKEAISDKDSPWVMWTSGGIQRSDIIYNPQLNEMYFVSAYFGSVTNPTAPSGAYQTQPGERWEFGFDSGVPSYNGFVGPHWNIRSAGNFGSLGTLAGQNATVNGGYQITGNQTFSSGGINLASVGYGYHGGFPQYATREYTNNRSGYIPKVDPGEAPDGGFKLASILPFSISTRLFEKFWNVNSYTGGGLSNFNVHRETITTSTDGLTAGAGGSDVVSFDRAKFYTQYGVINGTGTGAVYLTMPTDEFTKAGGGQPSTQDNLIVFDSVEECWKCSCIGISQLCDVNLNTPEGNQLLVYNGNTWVNQSATALLLQVLSNESLVLESTTSTTFTAKCTLFLPLNTDYFVFYSAQISNSNLNFHPEMRLYDATGLVEYDLTELHTKGDLNSFTVYSGFVKIPNGQLTINLEYRNTNSISQLDIKNCRLFALPL